MDIRFSSRLFIYFAGISLSIISYLSTATLGQSSVSPPLTDFSAAQPSDIFTVPTTISYFDNENLNILLQGTLSGNTSVEPDQQTLTSLVRTQLSGLCRLYFENRVTNIQYRKNNVAGAAALRFTLTPGSSPTNREAVNNIYSLLNQQNTIVTVLLVEPDLVLSLLPDITKWTENGPCPNQTCPVEAACNANFTGSFYCSTTSTSIPGDNNQGNSKLGLIALVAIPVVIAGVIAGAAIYMYDKRKKEEKKKEMARAMEEKGRGQVYQNTVGKSYATVFNNSIFLKNEKATEDDASDHRSSSNHIPISGSVA